MLGYCGGLRRWVFWDECIVGAGGFTGAGGERQNPDVRRRKYATPANLDTLRKGETRHWDQAGHWNMIRLDLLKVGLASDAEVR